MFSKMAASPPLVGRPPDDFASAAICAEIWRRVQGLPRIGRNPATCLWIWPGGYKYGAPPASGRPARCIIYANREQVSRMKWLGEWRAAAPQNNTQRRADVARHAAARRATFARRGGAFR